MPKYQIIEKQIAKKIALILLLSPGNLSRRLNLYLSSLSYLWLIVEAGANCDLLRWKATASPGTIPYTTPSLLTLKHLSAFLTYPYLKL
ncbi:hypothetical protein O71_14491 [Pontibacter sp. BAB1700]|nr:hypothetical protein O71_14491 [Pontibacter sp. BAB1700]